MENYKAIEDYQGFQRTVSITHKQNKYGYSVLISIQGCDGTERKRMLVEDRDILNHEAAYQAADNNSITYIDDHLKYRNAFKNFLQEKLDNNDAIQDIELGNWEVVKEKLYLPYRIKGNFIIRGIEEPDDFSDIEVQERRVKLIEIAFNQIKEDFFKINNK